MSSTLLINEIPQNGAISPIGENYILYLSKGLIHLKALCMSFHSVSLFKY